MSGNRSGGLYGRYLFKGDSLTNRNTKRVLDGYFRDPSGLFLPQTLQGVCGGCGVEKARSKKDFISYFGDEFCSDCVEKWKAGHK